MRNKLRLGALAASFLCAAGMAMQAQSAPAESASLIRGVVNNNDLVVLAHNTRPEARVAANDRGPVASNRPMIVEVLLRRPVASEKAFQRAITDLSNPASPNFHHWMTNAQIAQYSANASDIGQVKSWLKSQGVHIDATSPDHTFITISGTAAQMESTFNTPIHNLDVKGVPHIANMADPRIPAALASIVAGPVALHDFHGHPEFVRKIKRPPHPHLKKNGTSSDGELFYIMPEDLATIYNFNPLYQAGITGKGQTIVVIEDTDLFKMADWNVFRAVGGLGGYKDATLTTVHPSGSAACTDPGVNGAEGEAAIDVDWASAAAPDANIVLASCKDVGSAVTGFGGLLALQNLVNGSNPPKIISMSYGECEVGSGQAGNAAFNSIYQTAVAKGVTVFVSSGDEDASSCDSVGISLSGRNETDGYEAGIGVSGWASSPYDVAVGGTDFGTMYNLCQAPGSFPACMNPYWKPTNDKAYGTAKSYMPEVPWNDSCAGQLVSTFEGYTTAYGSTGYCNSANAKGTTLNNTQQDNGGGSGGPSGCATGSGNLTTGVVSGNCAGWAKPAYQAGFKGIVNDGVRDIPDISLFASNGWWQSYYIVCDSENNGSEGSPTGCTGFDPENWAGYGGTSISSPIMAGVQALINQKTGQSWGLANTQYYALAATQYGANGDPTCDSTKGNQISSSCVFNDVTQGDMTAVCGFSVTYNTSTLAISAEASLPGTANCYKPSGTVGVLSTSNSAFQPAYPATTGWDMATGIGTINATNLVNAWAAAFGSHPTSQSVR